MTTFSSKLLLHAVLGCLVGIAVASLAFAFNVFAAGIAGAVIGAVIGAACLRIASRGEGRNALEQTTEIAERRKLEEGGALRKHEPDGIEDPPPVTNAMRLLSGWPSREEVDSPPGSERFDLDR